MGKMVGEVIGSLAVPVIFFGASILGALAYGALLSEPAWLVGGFPGAYGLIGGEANKIEPGKRMLSSMSPTIVRKDGRNFLVTGSPGGSRIITTTLQVVMNVIDHNMNIQTAVNAPRIHHQWLPDELRIEQGISPDTIQLLEARGHKVNTSTAMGAIQSIMIGGEGTLYGGADPRRSTSSAVGY